MVEDLNLSDAELAFPMDELGVGPSGKFRLLGDIVISVDTAARQARARRHALVDEVTHLLAHGLLHLIGYDHRTNSEEREMNAAAARLVGAASGVLLPEESLPRHVRNRR
jgi:probable rRNA maturation factor